MIDETRPEFDIGLSEEEKDDLEKLIRTMREEQSIASSDPALEDLETRIKMLTEHVARLSEMTLKFDSRMKSFYEIIRLFYQKSENMNERINTIIRYIKNKNNL